MDINSNLNFGKYKGRTTYEVWTGKYHFNEREIIKNYFIELINHITFKELTNCIPIPSCKLQITNKNAEIFINETSKFEIVVTDSYIIIEKAEGDLLNSIKSMIQIILEGNFCNIGNYSYLKRDGINEKDLKYSENTDRLMMLQADPLYIRWCLENVEYYFINPLELEVLITTNSRFLKTFEFSILKENMIEYKPVFHEYNISISEKTIEVNTSIFERNKISSISYNSNSEDSFYYGDGDDEPPFCGMCQESPCRCSDPF